MKIAVDIRPLLSARPSGVGFYTRLLLTSLLQLDKSNGYFLYLNCFKPLPVDLPPSWSKRAQIIKTNIPSKVFSVAAGLFAYDWWKIKADIFWLPGINFISWPKGAKRVITCHDISWLIMPEFYSRKSRWWHKLTRAVSLFKQADLILSVSESTKNDLIEHLHLPADKIRVTPLGVEPLEVTSSQLGQVKARYNLPEKFLFYLGNIEPRKNIEGILDSFVALSEKFPDLHLVIAGGPGWHPAYVKEIKKRIAQIPQVHYLGYLAEEDKWAFYRLAQAFVYPSFYEGFGLPPLEAMSQGCPVVVSAVSSLPEVVGQAGLLVDPYNTSQIIYALERLLIDKQLRDELIQAGYKQSLRFSWPRAAKRVLDAFNNLK